MAPRRKPVEEVEEVAAPARRTRAPKLEVVEDTRKRFNPAELMMTEIDAIEKRTGYTNDGIGRYSPRLSTGVLAIDMYMDGGLVAGGWYTAAGGEQSCKSTLTMTLLASVVKQNFRGIGAIFDFEGSTDENYILSIFKNFKIEIDPATIFGVQDPTTGEWLVRGRFRYYPPTNGERFFDYMAQLRKMLPDKVVESTGEGYLIYENTVPNRKLVGDSYDKNYFRRNNKFKVLAEDAGAQAIVVVDSYPSMLPDSMDGDDKAGALAIQARMFSDGIKRFRGSMRKKMITILGVNQLRKNPMNQYEPEYEPCGEALKFFCFDPETELCIDSNFVKAIDVYEEGKQLEIMTRQGVQKATIFKTDGGDYKESITLNYSGVDLTCSIGHAVLTVVQDSVASPLDDLRLVDIGRVSWKRAKDAPMFAYGFVLNDPHYTSKLSCLPPAPADNKVHLRNYLWYHFITKMFPVLRPTINALQDLLIADSSGFLYNSTMLQELVNNQYFTDPNCEVLCGNEYEDISMALAHLDDVFALLDESRDFVPVLLTEKAVVEERPAFYLDVNEPVTGTVVTNGVLSHNSDVRFRLQSRAIPAPFKGERKVVEEDSVEFPGTVDRYRFISGRSHKNKLGGIPNQEFWMRLWEADGAGKGRGFDPVYDVFFYLKEIKILYGNMGKFKFAEPCPLSKAKRTVSWQDLRVLVLGNKKQISDMCAKLEIRAFSIRKWCFDFVKTDKSKALVTASVVAKAGAIKDDEEGL
jgi:RecA/RadA recombinase